MFGQFLLIVQTIICCIIVSSFGVSANGASINSYESTSMESFNMKEANDLKRYKLMEHNLFYSDELTSTEYHHDNVNDKYDNQHDLVELDEFNLNKHSVENTNKDWDVLIFTQQWPVTTCYHWREENTNHKCNLPSDKYYWTIHGIWPTKLGHIGPNFCNNSANFNKELLNKILPNMNNYWPDIDMDNSSDEYWLWKHEWLKHGTCAASLEQLNNELKYFSTGLNWRQNYLLSRILEEASIYPDSNNTVVAIHAALVSALGKNPSIHCLYDAKTETSFLAEIRICFNKTLQLVNCDGVLGEAVYVDYPGGTLITNCHISKPVFYPTLMPGQHHVDNVNKHEDKGKPSSNWKFPIVNLYKLIQFIMWFTL